MVSRLRIFGTAITAIGFGLMAAATVTAAHGQPGDPYAAMAPLDQYLMADKNAEIALARSAAPPSVSDDAEVLVLGRDGYETAAKGKNGFVCMVQRAWFSGLDDAEFWNPKERSPICFNPQGARSVLPTFVERTKWVLAGVPRTEMIRRTKAEVEAKTIPAPETGTMTYMMSKNGYLSDGVAGPWHPHLMFFVPRVPAADWGANLPGAPVMGGDGGLEPWSLFFVPVTNWSDGTPDSNPIMAHKM